MWKKITKDFKSLPPIVQLIAVALILFGIFMGARALFKLYKKNAQQKVKENSTVNTDVNGVPITVNLGTSATNIHTAFHDNDWFGISEDEQKAMTELENVPKKAIPNLSTVYFQLYSKNLKEEFQKYLSDTQYNSISTLFN